MTNLKEIAKTYFEHFSNKNLSELKKMFTEDVELRDWNFSAQGLEDVIKINEKIFANNSKILVRPLKLWEVNNDKDKLIFADLEIDTGKEKKEIVLDILTFKNDKIKKITAYKGN